MGFRVLTFEQATGVGGLAVADVLTPWVTSAPDSGPVTTTGFWGNSPVVPSGVREDPCINQFGSATFKPIYVPNAHVLRLQLSGAGEMNLLANVQEIPEAYPAR